MKKLYLGFVAAACALAGPVAAQTPNPAPTVAELLAKTPAARGIFVAQDDGTAWHIKSGLVCPLTFPNQNLWHLEIFAADGSDVGCDYGRNGPDNVAVAKLTIFATRARPGDTVDSVFAGYKMSITAKYPDARMTGPAITFQGDPPPDMKDIRSAEYKLAFNGHASQSDLVVAIQAGWVIEIRADTATEISDTQQAAMATEDNALPLLGLMQALKTVGVVTSTASNP